MSTDRLYVRTDATPDTGLGHFMRCLALAQAWRDSGAPVTFIGRYAPALVPLLRDEGIAHVDVAQRHPAPGDLATTIAHVPTSAIVVLDGYAFDVDFQHRLGEDRRLLVIDDVGDRDAYAGFALLNPNVDAASIRYRAAPAQRLLGSRYAPLRRAFRQRAAELRSAARRATAPTDGHNVLVSLGGADVDNHTLRLLRCLVAAPDYAAAICAVIGPLNPHVAALEAFAAKHQTVELVVAPTDLLERLCSSDVVIAAAGSISAELAALGVPALLFAVADNQKLVGPAMQRAGAALFGGDFRTLDDDALAATVTNALRDTTALVAMCERGPSLIDGQGALRVCDFLRNGKAS